jgi:hypothetical protein
MAGPEISRYGVLYPPASWGVNDDGVQVPRRTEGSIAAGYGFRDFALVCRICGDEWENTEQIGMVAAHFHQHHPGEPKVRMALLWLGRGPAPGSPRMLRR